MTVRSEQNLIHHNSTDAYAPAEIAQRVENAGVAKAGLATIPTLVLAVLAGAFIAFGAMLYVVVVTNSGLGFGPDIEKQSLHAATRTLYFARPRS